LDISVIFICTPIVRLHRVQKKRDQQYFGHNCDKFKCIVVIYAAIIIAKVMQNYYSINNVTV